MLRQGGLLWCLVIVEAGNRTQIIAPTASLSVIAALFDWADETDGSDALY